MHAISIDADRRLRGPYTLAAALLEELVPAARPGLVAAHDLEIDVAAPSLGVPLGRRSLADSLPRPQRILIPGARRTLRIANGLAEFIRDHLRESGPLRLTAVNLGEADPTDTELVEVLGRRVPGELLEIVRGPSAPSDRPYVADFGRFRDQGFHHAMAESGLAALGELDYDADPEAWQVLVQRVASALEAIEREDEARELYDRARRLSTDPKHRATIAYGTAMLLVRHHDPARRDPEEALAWINEAVTITSLLPDPAERAFHLSFDLNGKALVEVRRARFGAALSLVREAIALAEGHLGEEHPIHRLVLRANRAQLMMMGGHPGEALADYSAAIEADPGYPDYYLERGNLLHKLGRLDDALVDYEQVIRLSPPFPEAHYNRAEIRFATGDLDGARADLDYAIELDPEFAPAYVNRAGLFAAIGEYGSAGADVARGLELDAGNPYLLCVRGQVEAAAGHPAEARAAYDAALAKDPELAPAWAGRAELAFESGDHAGALADLERAIGLGESAGLLFNRALVLRAAGRTDEAVKDLLRAAELDPDDADIRDALG